MGLGVFKKIVKSHLVSGNMRAGEPISIKIDQTLTQDATGTMVYLEFEALGLKKVKTELSVSYVDHNLMQNGFMNADDHRFLQTSASKYGVYFSRPGNGICHQLHLERFSIPGKTLLGSDSHTPTAGGIGMVAIGAGGLDVALAMAGEPYSIVMPEVVKVDLRGRLMPFVSAKDIILRLLQMLTVKGGVNKVFEYTGPALKYLDVTERATITNMGTELGATTSIFPSDEVTYRFMKSQGRERDWFEILPDEDAEYESEIVIDLDELEPLVAQPHSPDNVVKVKEIEGKKVDQVAIGSCTNSSFKDLMKVALMLRGKRVHPGVSVALNPGSRQVMLELQRNGALEWILSAGVRILEMGCGPCIGMGFSPPTGGVSLRTYNRNFYGRSGTKSAFVYLVSPETAVASAITGVITDPRHLGMEPIIVREPEKYVIDDTMILPPSPDPESVEVIKGPNIVSLELKGEMEDTISAEVLIKVGDNITTDHIMPAGANILPLRSNLPEISKHVFEAIDPGFYERARRRNGGIIVGGENYGQGSSREHAALAPMYLGIKAVIATSFARIHRANLVNAGIIPLIIDKETYNRIEQGDLLKVDVELDKDYFRVVNLSKSFEFQAKVELSDRDRQLLKAGGILPFYKKKLSGEV
ncbi:MAG: aconitate hydratase [Synergistetes bacterium]|nr:aconitate hydratase [Synergistota bacterium]